MSQNEKDFFAKLQFMSQVVRLYEDPHIQQVALSHVPVEELKKKAKKADKMVWTKKIVFCWRFLDGLVCTNNLFIFCFC